MDYITAKECRKMGHYRAPGAGLMQARKDIRCIPSWLGVGNS